MSQTCDNRFNDGVYLLKCSLDEGHPGRLHADGDTKWTNEQGFVYVYENGVVVGTVPEQVEPEFQPVEEVAEPPPVTTKKLSIAERLAERKALNVSLTKPKP